MSNDLLAEMKMNGVDIGSLVEICLKEGIHFFSLKITTVPTYHLAKGGLSNNSTASKCVGYVADIGENKIGLVPGWDTKNNCMAEDGYIGGMNIHADAIGSYGILSSPVGVDPQI